MAPELLNDQSYSERTDIYAFAMLCFEMITFMVPFHELSIHQAACRILTGQRPKLPPNCPQWMFELITSCWQTRPASRPAFTQISSQLDAMILSLSSRQRSSLMLRRPSSA